MFRAAALTALVARDMEWQDGAEVAESTSEWKIVPLARTDYRTDSDNVYFQNPQQRESFPRPMKVDEWEFHEDIIEDEDEQYG